MALLLLQHQKYQIGNPGHLLPEHFTNKAIANRLIANKPK